ncbi:hypothetical protein PtA15_8A699 [Puccinia triticina]|uniref:Uncharacterized protein n=1 Tax=Puccinia triticina TaxID=208348 RepID=A0ABY7CYJ9_9BASI|nr:uncharacterized protein PtA15_8A699 [Puccinia triticina]WAQ87792.1 hypothetical protein PtA15_8A699 [Puccinia triticina]WAR57666.1 hypothetical protein PtB15_8B719 [Puccinia triticina]
MQLIQTRKKGMVHVSTIDPSCHPATDQQADGYRPAASGHLVTVMYTDVGESYQDNTSSDIVARQDILRQVRAP